MLEFPREPVRAFETPEGHNVEQDDRGQLVGLVLMNVRSVLGRDGELKLTWPASHLSASALGPVVASA